MSMDPGAARAAEIGGAGFAVWECRACGHRVYPRRLWCPACGGRQARPASVDEAEVLACTRVPGPEGDTVLATLRALPRGPQLVARVAGPPVRAGQRVRLRGAADAQGRVLPWTGPPPAA
ncbi:zinc ribbon domain-containing protein [Achromobacter sp. Marseille-Q4962]|uniref:zinc ribbon domain-containing protein n=1 Tax=Achromobacter sp. Marseille-Q4962 TaxID=2942202 RepID=UPI00207470B7|nr:zinc ribbon domain-containing protein [Achromobacter sp. Marseille-Q4962]